MLKFCDVIFKILRDLNNHCKDYIFFVHFNHFDAFSNVRQ